MDPPAGVHILRDCAHRDMTAMLPCRLDDFAQYFEVVGVPEGVEYQLDVSMDRRQRTRPARQVLLLVKHLQHPLSRRGSDIWAAVEDLGDGRGGNSGALSYLLQRHSLRSWVHVTNSLACHHMRKCRIILRNYFGKRIEGPAMDLLSLGSAADI
jgi:hypothetical protein